MQKLYNFSLDNFEGPLELLIYLIQKDEIDICSIEIKNLTSQFIQALESSNEVETSSEAMHLTALLLLLKSQKLLPLNEESATEAEEDLRVTLIQNLLEYCQFKEAAKALCLREEQQKAHFPRATTPFCRETPMGLETVDIDNLKALFNKLLERSFIHPKEIILDEEWQISQKLEWLRQELYFHKKILFNRIFTQDKSRKELIVLFLALLEMMKDQELQVVREMENLYIVS